MVTAEELTVAIRSDGVSETESDLQGVERAMDETADSAGDSAAELEDFSERFGGAMSATIAGLAVGAAGILSQVPVIGEAMSGLGAILDAFILQIDDDLRPALNGFNQDLFEVANNVAEAEGSLEAFRIATDGVGQAIQDLGVDQLQSEIQSLTGITIPENWLDLGWDIITIDTRNAVDTLTRVVREFPEDFGTLLGSISPMAKKQYDKVIRDTQSFVDGAVSAISRFPGQARSEFTELASGLNEWAADLSSDAREWGRNIIQKMIDGIRSMIGKLRDKLTDLQSIAPGVNVNVPDIGVGGGGGGSDGGGGLFGGLSGGGGGSGATLDGRQLTESTGRYRSDPGRRRGL